MSSVAQQQKDSCTGSTFCINGSQPCAQRGTLGGLVNPHAVGQASPVASGAVRLSVSIPLLLVPVLPGRWPSTHTSPSATPGAATAAVGHFALLLQLLGCTVQPLAVASHADWLPDDNLVLLPQLCVHVLKRSLGDQ